jgi:iron complex outermembrane receptor protein
MHTPSSHALRVRLPLSLLLLVPATNVLAQHAPSPTPSSHDSEEPVLLHPVVVTAPRSEHPFVVELDAKAPTQPMPAQDGADFLKAVPGFSVIRKGGTDGDPVFRGMAGSRLVVALDGQCVLGGCGNRMDPPTAYVFPAAYDKVTILKGPQTVLHGPGNSAGVVLFESERERLAEAGVSGHLTSTIGSFGRFDFAADATAGTPDFFTRLAATRTEAGDYEDGAGNRVHARHLRWSVNAAAGWTPNEDTRLEISAARSDGEAAYADRMMDGVVFDRENFAIDFRRDAISPLVTHTSLEFGYNYVDHVMDNYSLRAFAPSMMMPNPSVSNPDRRTVGGRATVGLALSSGLTGTIGLDLQRNDHAVRGSNNQNAMPYEVRPRVADARFDQLGLYGEWTLALSDASSLVGGIRIDHWAARDSRASVAVSMMTSMPNPTANAKRDDDLLSGFVRFETRLGRTGAKLHAGLGHTERFLDYWELIKNESPTSLSAFDTAPEKTTQFDLGVSHRFGALHVSLSAFANRIDDFALVQNGFVKPSGMMGTRTAVVTRSIEASTWGAELSADWTIAEHWRLDTSLAYVRGENETDDRPLAQIPPLESRLGVTYSQRVWSAGALVRLVGSQDRVAVGQGNIVGQDIGPSDGFAVFSINASWRVQRALRLTAGVDNLFDELYAEHVSRAGGMLAGYPQTTRVNEPGRTLWARLDVAF